MIDEDPGIGSIPYYFEYKLQKRNLLGDTLSVAEGGYDGEWISTLEYPDISNALHSAIRSELLGGPNALITNTSQDSTYLIARAIDSALITSDEVEISFIVKNGFSPGTVIYYREGDNNKANAIHALGSNHFLPLIPDGTNIDIKSINTTDGIHYSTPFWIDSENNYTAIGSSDFKTYIRWGYNGEYEENHPFLKKNEEVLDDSTGDQYFCEIIGYDIRLDNKPYYYPPIPAEGINLQVDDDGKEWLRIDVGDPIDQLTTVTRSSFGDLLEELYGEHTLEVRSIDLQGAVDLTPDKFIYTVVAPIPKEEKAGVLIIDDDTDTPQSPGAEIDSLYTYFISDYTTEFGYINRKDLNVSLDIKLHQSIIAPSDMQQYKVIIYHSDDGRAEFDFWKEYETFKIYLLQGGNLILSGGDNLKTINFKLTENGFDILYDYFGIPMTDDAIGRISSSYSVNPFFIKAVSEGVYNDIDLLLPSFNTTITNPNAPVLSVDGLGPVAYFNEEEDGFDAEIIYSYGSKEVSEDPPGNPYHINPNQEEYDLYNGLPIALKKVTENNSCYIFGFPLTYMEPDQVKTMMTQILTELP